MLSLWIIGIQKDDFVVVVLGELRSSFYPLLNGFTIPIGTFHQANLLTALEKFLVRYQSILYKDANILPFLLKPLSVFFKEFIEFVRYFFADVARNFLHLTICL